jgi:predicted ArsR family transcriptional regulator
VSTRSILEELPATRAAILRLLKAEGFASIGRIGEALGVSHEGARKHVADLERKGWVGTDCATEESDARGTRRGRPSVRYCLTPAGDHFFPKQYPALAITLIDAIAAEGGEESLAAILTRITDERVADLAPRTTALPLKRKMNVLQAIYRDRDPDIDVQRRGEDYVLIERNCPFLTVAMERPEICSTTVSTLRRLTGCQVVRERRFQDGDGRCEFHVRTSPNSPENGQIRFEWEPLRTPTRP